MQKPLRIKVYELVGSSAAVASEDGINLFKRIDKAFENKKDIIIDFNNIELITSTFLNSSIGQLYGKYDSTYLNMHLKVENLAPEDLSILKKVIDRAKEYFKDKEKIEKAIDEVLNND